MGDKERATEGYGCPLKVTVTAWSRDPCNDHYKLGNDSGSLNTRIPEGFELRKWVQLFSPFYNSGWVRVHGFP